MSNETAIIKGLAEGKNEAYEYVYDQYYSILCSYANYFVNDPFVSESIVANVIFNLWKNRENSSIQDLRNYLLKATKNQSLNYIRQQKRSEDIKDHLQTLQNQKQIFYDQQDDYPLTKLYGKEMYSKLMDSLDKMPELTRKVFHLSRYENLGYAEIADKTGLSIDSVKYHMKSALKKLREDLKDFY